MKYHYRHGDRPIDGYTVLRGVGSGGFGEVYYARSDGGRDVALKTVLRNEDVELRGVRQCINLKSPNLVSIFDVRKDSSGVPFVIMEYVAGPSLREILRQRPGGLGVDEAGFLSREIARGLSALHRHGVVHRDLKPENIFLEDGFVKIGDYGLAKFMNASHASGQTISVGTVHYMAPEIGSGNYDRTIDIYALGIIVYELLRGEVPFQGDSIGEVLMKHLTAEADLSGVPKPFHAAILGALEKKPEARFQSVEDMAASLPEGDGNDARRETLSPQSLSEIAGEIHRARQLEAPEAAVGPPPPPRLAADVAAAATAATAATAYGSSRSDAAGGAQGMVERPVAPDRTPSAPEERPRSEAKGAWFSEPDPREIEAALERTSKAMVLSVWVICRRIGAAAWKPVRSLYLAAAGDARGEPHAPGTAARLFWGAAGWLLTAGGIACFALTNTTHGDDLIALLAAGVVMIGYSTFSFYRGLWARRQGLWARSILPFLAVTAAIVAAFVLSLGLGEPQALGAIGVYAAILTVGAVVIGRFLRRKRRPAG